MLRNVKTEDKLLTRGKSYGVEQGQSVNKIKCPFKLSRRIAP